MHYLPGATPLEPAGYKENLKWVDINIVILHILRVTTQLLLWKKYLNALVNESNDCNKCFMDVPDFGLPDYPAGSG